VESINRVMMFSVWSAPGRFVIEKIENSESKFLYGCRMGKFDAVGLVRGSQESEMKYMQEKT
jgi:hypothetical protein